MLSLCACMQGTESWERRLVEARHEHGLLEWELDKADGAPDPTQQLLRSPLPGIAALLCTEEEICARQQQLAKAGALKRMRVPETQLEANFGDSRAAAAADKSGCPNDAEDAGSSLEQPQAAPLDRKGGVRSTGSCSSHLEPVLVGLSTQPIMLFLYLYDPCRVPCQLATQALPEGPYDHLSVICSLAEGANHDIAGV